MFFKGALILNENEPPLFSQSFRLGVDDALLEPNGFDVPSLEGIFHHRKDFFRRPEDDNHVHWPLDLTHFAIHLFAQKLRAGEGVDGVNLVPLDLQIAGNGVGRLGWISA